MGVGAMNTTYSAEERRQVRKVRQEFCQYTSKVPDCLEALVHLGGKNPRITSDVLRRMNGEVASLSCCSNLPGTVNVRPHHRGAREARTDSARY